MAELKVAPKFSADDVAVLTQAMDLQMASYNRALKNSTIPAMRKVYEDQISLAREVRRKVEVLA